MTTKRTPWNRSDAGPRFCSTKLAAAAIRGSLTLAVLYGLLLIATSVQAQTVGQDSTTSTPPAVAAQGSDTQETATLKGGAICYPDRRNISIRCQRQNFLTKGLLDMTPRLHFIDGKGPRELGRKGGLDNGTFNSFWDAGFKVPLTPGRHAVSVSFHQGTGTMQATSADVTVAFVAVSGHSYVVDSLVTASTGLFNPRGWTPIIFDVTEKENQLVPVWSSPALGLPIHDAASDGDLAKVKTLLGENPDLISRKDNEGMTPLHWAAQNDRQPVAELLLASQTDIDAKDNNGNTPLELAVVYGHKSLAELLLANRADARAKNNVGGTPLHAAAGNGIKEIVELLLANHADVDAKTNTYQTPLVFAASHGQKEIVELLLANKADVNAKDSNGDTPLHFAAGWGHTDVVELLLANGADVNARNNRGRTPLDLAAASHHKDAAQLLRHQGGQR